MKRPNLVNLELEDLSAINDDKPTATEKYIEELESIINEIKNNKPDCHFYDEEEDKWVWAYSADSIENTLKLNK